VLHTQAATLTATSDKDCGLVDQNNNTRARKQRKLGVLRRNFYNAASSVDKTTFLDSSGFHKQLREERKGANYTTTEETSDRSLMQQPADFRVCVHKSRLDFRRNNTKEDTTKQQRLQRCS
jgi:hypothetical protein